MQAQSLSMMANAQKETREYVGNSCSPNENPTSSSGQKKILTNSDVEMEIAERQLNNLELRDEEEEMGSNERIRK